MWRYTVFTQHAQPRGLWSDADVSQFCKSASRSRQITMPASHHSVFYRLLDALPATQPTVSKHWRHNITSVPFWILPRDSVPSGCTVSVDIMIELLVFWKFCLFLIVMRCSFTCSQCWVELKWKASVHFVWMKTHWKAVPSVSRYELSDCHVNIPACAKGFVTVCNVIVLLLNA